MVGGRVALRRHRLLLSAAALAGLTLVGTLDRRHPLVLAPARPAPDVEPAGAPHQVLLRGVGIAAAGSPPATSRIPARLGRLSIGRALLVLGLPVVADLLEPVLQGAERRAVSALALAVLIDGRVVRLAPGPLRLLR